MHAIWMLHLVKSVLFRKVHNSIIIFWLMTTVYRTVRNEVNNLILTSHGNRCLNIHKIRDVKLSWLQMRIPHRIIATNTTLKDIRVVDDIRCNFCSNERASIIEHVIWKCNCIRLFWKKNLRSSIGSVEYVTVLNFSATWAATFRLRGYKCMLVIFVFP